MKKRSGPDGIPAREHGGMGMKKHAAWWLVLVACAEGICAGAERQKPPAFKPPLTRVAVFKNGYAFTFREGEAVLREGSALTAQVPTAVLGTFWGYSLAPKIHVTGLFTSEIEEEEARKVESLHQLLLRNEGARVRISTHDKDVFEGAYTVLTAKVENTGDGSVPVSEMYPAMPMPGFDIAVQTERGTAVLNGNRIALVEFLGEPRWERPLKLKRRQLEIRTDSPGSGPTARLGIAALEKGFRWIPGYRIELKGDRHREAKLELEATLINDLADAEGTDFYFVVGVPHFLMQDAVSPLSLRNAFAEVTAALPDMRNNYQRMMMSQSAAPGTGGGFGGESPAPEPTVPTVAMEEQLPGVSAEELFLYRAEKLSLKKGSRASLRLFSLTVPCSEVFEWTIQDPSQPSPYQPAPPRDRLALESLNERVWYALKLKNDTKMPWTTGPALSFREWKPIGQDMMSFTPAGGEVIVKVTPATEVVGEHTQQEKDRKLEARQSYGVVWDLVTVEGTIRLRNVKKEPVEVVVTRRTEGEITQTSPQAKISKEGLQLQAINPISVIRWQMALPPGDKELRYTYQRYIRRN
ncbi:MAG: hypothetical protein IT210_07835 [Armatimonadetes bacterium]|nr:hypothetical protein [Armatimonadota bacterium]